MDDRTILRDTGHALRCTRIKVSALLKVIHIYEDDPEGLVEEIKGILSDLIGIEKIADQRFAALDAFAAARRSAPTSIAAE